MVSLFSIINKQEIVLDCDQSNVLLTRIIFPVFFKMLFCFLNFY